ncbi:MAG: hypothetical protein H7256_02185 [Bdellovibrio sp.]|nr:hypothetical protein [Bdellovibrio sp.]
MRILNLLSILVIFGLTLSTSAQNNPQIRACNQTGGEFKAAKTENDEVGLCKYGQAYIGTIDLLNYRDNQQGAQSLQTYIDGIQSCEPYGQMKTITILQSLSIDVCSFDDGSMIEAETLRTGRHDPRNAQLNRALEIRF